MQEIIKKLEEEIEENSGCFQELQSSERRNGYVQGLQRAIEIIKESNNETK